MSSSDSVNSNPDWTSISLKYAPEAVVEINVRPTNFQNGLIVRISEATHHKLSKTNLLHLRHILDSANIPPDTISKWKINGREEDSMFGWNPAFEQVIPKSDDNSNTEFLVYFNEVVAEPETKDLESDAEIDLDGINLDEIQFDEVDETTIRSPKAAPQNFVNPVQGYVNPPQQFIPQQMPMPPAGIPPQQFQQPIPSATIQSSDSSNQQSFDYTKGIESDWIAVLQMEKQMAGLRSQLVTTQTALNSLNKDLSGKEAQQADQLDKKNWQDARRWMRDSSTKISVSVRDFDIGPTSGAGKRDWFEQMYETICVNKQPVPNMKDVHREFGNFRNQVKTLFNSMNSVKSAAERDGIQRANRILNAIRAKKRDPRRSR